MNIFKVYFYVLENFSVFRVIIAIGPKGTQRLNYTSHIVFVKTQIR